MSDIPLNPLEPEQPKPTREDLVALGLQPVTAFLLPSNPKHTSDQDRKRQLDRDRQDKSRKNRTKDGLVRLDGYATKDDVLVIRKLAKASVTGTFDQELRSLAPRNQEECEIVTGHINMPAPGVDIWIYEYQAAHAQRPQPSPSPLSKEHCIGSYMLHTKGWRRWAANLACWHPIRQWKAKRPR
jgi:hypothetical protein